MSGLAVGYPLSEIIRYIVFIRNTFTAEMITQTAIITIGGVVKSTFSITERCIGTNCRL